MKKTKIFAAYLPQFHETEDNNKFWGKGYTDWVGVKKAKPLFEGHVQPRVPMNNNYYDLSKIDSIRWQAKLARQYGVNGFNIYHYWFKDGKQELFKPAELLLNNKEIDIEFFFTWDNCSWRRTWSNIPGNDWAPLFENNSANSATGTKEKKSSTLVEFEYGDELQWKNHFLYLLEFFKDKRYLKIDNKPVFAFVNAFNPDELKKMCEYWETLAIESGFSGVYMIIQKGLFKDKIKLKNSFVYEPISSSWGVKKSLEAKITKIFKINLFGKGKPVKYMCDYDTIWRTIIKKTKRNKCIPGCFVRYDDTPRRGKNGGVIVGETPEKFEKYFSLYYKTCCEKDFDFLLITAWNEWGEGAYLEPDERDEYSYLEALKSAISK